MLDFSKTDFAWREAHTAPFDGGYYRIALEPNRRWSVHFHRNATIYGVEEWSCETLEAAVAACERDAADRRALAATQRTT